MNIPILDKPIKTMMYYYSIKLDILPPITIDTIELSQVKLGNNILGEAAPRTAQNVG